MTEQKWLSSHDPAAMLEAAYHDANPSVKRISDRKLRLFACAVCRQVWHLLTDAVVCPTCIGHKRLGNAADWMPCPDCSGTGRSNRSRRAVEVAEKFADGLATEQELEDARANAIRVPGAEFPSAAMLAAACCGNRPADAAVQILQAMGRGNG